METSVSVSQYHNRMMNVLLEINIFYALILNKFLKSWVNQLWLEPVAAVPSHSHTSGRLELMSNNNKSGF